MSSVFQLEGYDPQILGAFLGGSGCNCAGCVACATVPPASPTNLGNWFTDKLNVGTLVALVSPILLGLGVIAAIWWVQAGRRNALAGQVTRGSRYHRRR